MFTCSVPATPEKNLEHPEVQKKYMWPETITVKGCTTNKKVTLLFIMPADSSYMGVAVTNKALLQIGALDHCSFRGTWRMPLRTWGRQMESLQNHRIIE